MSSALESIITICFIGYASRIEISESGWRRAYFFNPFAVYMRFLVGILFNHMLIRRYSLRAVWHFARASMEGAFEHFWQI